MKRLLPLFCILVILFASAGMASAEEPLPGKFTITITGQSPYPYPFPWAGNSGRIIFDGLTASGSVVNCDGAAVDVLCPASFSYEEKGNVDLSSFTGTNQGVMTIWVSGGQAVIRFNGQVNSGSVSGNWVVLSGSDSLSALHGQGTYFGEPFSSSVQFEGQFFN